jgi:hypothetical protein
MLRSPLVPLALLRFCGLLTITTMGCSSETQTPPVAKPIGLGLKKSISYTGPDSLPRYFPAQVARPQSNCNSEYRLAGQHLMAFNAAVLYNKYTGQPTYRFIWLRSFHRPALLTLKRFASGGILYTQYLNKSPGDTTAVLDTVGTPDMSPKARQAHRERWRKLLADSAFMRDYRARAVFAKAPVRVTNKVQVQLTTAQIQQFDNLLSQAAFWQLSSCQPSDGIVDGAYWFLEAREANRYHVVFCHSPDAGSQLPFRRCCEFLLNLSPARREERY